MSPSALKDTMRAEWIKILTVRSALWTLLMTFVGTVVLSTGFGLLFRHYFSDPGNEGPEDYDPVASGMSGLFYTQIALVAFGVLVISSEYSSHTIRASLIAVPRRGLFFGGKVAVTALVALGVSVVTVLVSFIAAEAAIGGPHNASLADEGAPRAVFGICLYLTLITVLSTGVATLLRSSVLSLGILLPLFLVVSRILSNLPGVGMVARYLPDQAGLQIMYVVPREGALGPWEGLLVLVIWTAAALCAGYLALRRRDT